MYAIHKQLHPPTGVEHAIYCHFFNRREKNLVVAGSNQLRVFKLTHNTDKTNNSQSTKMECLQTYSLFGNIMSLRSLAVSSRDALLLSFRDANLSLVEYDPETHDLKTLSIHYFERDETNDGRVQIHQIPEIRVDPDGRCAVMTTYDKILVLPLRKDTEDGKSPVLASYTIRVKELGEQMENIIDLQFLHGYYEPTLLFLYERSKTWTGRVAAHQDTCAVAAMSLNMQQRVHPVVWSLGNLPFDCLRVLEVPRPIGGVLVVATNALLYLNSVSAYGVSLNSATEKSTAFPLEIQSDVKLSLDCSQAAFISDDKLVVALKDGELYVVNILVDSGRGVRGFHFDKAASAVLATCVCVCGDGYLFLGSRLGNSLLLRCSEKSIDGDIVSEEPTRKKRKLENVGDDELSVYGSETLNTRATSATSLSFDVCDSLLNIGPCGQMSPGIPAFLSDEFANSSDPDVESVVTSGYGKNGAITVLQRSVKPQVVTSFELPGVVDMWTVIGREYKNPLDEAHLFLILSKNDRSMVLQTGNEITELDNTGFNTQEATVFAGNIGANKYIVQVSPMGVRLLEGPRQIQYIPLDKIVHASLADPYLMVMSVEGQLVLLTLQQNEDGACFTVTKPQISHEKATIIAMCMYRDLSGLFTTQVTAKSEEEGRKFDTNRMEVDDEEESLYGKKCDKPRDDASIDSEIIPTYWLVVVRDNGDFEIYNLGDFKLVYLVNNFPTGVQVLAEGLESASRSIENTFPVVNEILLVGSGRCGRRPILLARVDEDLFIYEAFPFATTENLLKLRFRKVGRQMVIRGIARACRRSYLRHFGDVASYSGVFVCGDNPHWLFLTSRGELRVHPMGIDGPIACFSPFHNVNCPKGFLYFNRKGELRVCVLPTHVSYDAPWPVRKVPLRRTAHSVSYHVESKTYCVVTSTGEEPCLRTVKSSGNDKEYEVVDRDDRFIYPTMEKFSVELFSPVSWEAIPNTKFDFDEWERVTCLKSVSLTYEGARSGLKEYVAIGTNYNYGEDVTSRGRMIIFEVTEVVPEPEQPLTRNKLKMVYGKEQKGPVTALCSVAGFLLSCIGQKMYVWRLKDADLVGIAFVDTQVYIHAAVSIKNLVLVADINRSVSLLRFQDASKTLSVVSRDVNAMGVYAIDFFVDDSRLGFLVSDGERNLSLFAYQPEVRESCGGQRLVRKADFHVGSNINSFFRIRGKGEGDKHVVVYASLDGSVGCLLPVAEKVYRRLLMVQNVLVARLVHTAGLNPKAFRAFRSHCGCVVNGQKNVLDGELVWKYLDLSGVERNEVSRKIGTTTGQIIEDLMSVDRATAHF